MRCSRAIAAHSVPFDGMEQAQMPRGIDGLDNERSAVSARQAFTGSRP